MQLMWDIAGVFVFMVGLVLSTVDVVFYLIHRFVAWVRYGLYIEAARLMRMDSDKMFTLRNLHRRELLD